MSEDIITDKPIEFTGAKQFCKDMIDGEKSLERIKEFVMYLLGAQKETLEIQQLHELMIKYDKKFDTIDRELRLLKGGLAVLATVIPGAQIVLNFLGIGG